VFIFRVSNVSGKLVDSDQRYKGSLDLSQATFLNSAAGLISLLLRGAIIKIESKIATPRHRARSLRLIEIHRFLRSSDQTRGGELSRGWHCANSPQRRAGARTCVTIGLGDRRARSRALAAGAAQTSVPPPLAPRGPSGTIRAPSPRHRGRS